MDLGESKGDGLCQAHVMCGIINVNTRLHFGHTKGDHDCLLSYIYGPGPSAWAQSTSFVCHQIVAQP